MTSEFTIDDFLRDCKKIEKACSGSEASSPIQILKQLESDFPNFFTHCNKFYKKCSPETHLVHFTKLLRQISKSTPSKDFDDPESSLLRNLDLDMSESKASKVNLSFDNLDNLDKTDDDNMIISTSVNKNPDFSQLDKEIILLKKREFKMLNRLSLLEKQMSIVMIENKNHIRKTYELQSELAMRSDFESLSLLQLHPIIEARVELKIYFWALYRRLHFFAKNIDIFRKQFIRVRETETVIKCLWIFISPLKLLY